MPVIIKDSLDSNLLGRGISYRVILPRGYEDQPDKIYPILYLLHGLFGSCDNFLDLTQIAEYISGKDLIVVLPEGENGWYSDSRTNAKNKFESYFWNELFPTIDEKYRVSRSKERRAIAGISMGGYGAFKMSFREPSAFAFAASMSGAFDAATRTIADSAADWDILGASLINVFGDKLLDAASEENDLFKTIEEISDQRIENLPELYFDCGDKDSFLKVNRRMANLLKSKKINFEYCEIKDGAHDWDYWNSRLPVILSKAMSRLALNINS